MEPSVIVTVGIALVGVIIWSVRQEGRLNAHDERHDVHEQRHVELRDDVRYIRQRIDSAINGKH